jgi:hypothetical protein
VDVDRVSPEMGSVAALTVASVSRAADRENSDQGGSSAYGRGDCPGGGRPLRAGFSWTGARQSDYQ